MQAAPISTFPATLLQAQEEALHQLVAVMREAAHLCLAPDEPAPGDSTSKRGTSDTARKASTVTRLLNIRLRAALSVLRMRPSAAASQPAAEQAANTQEPAPAPSHAPSNQPSATTPEAAPSAQPLASSRQPSGQLDTSRDCTHPAPLLPPFPGSLLKVKPRTPA